MYFFDICFIYYINILSLVAISHHANFSDLQMPIPRAATYPVSSTPKYSRKCQRKTQHPEPLSPKIPRSVHDIEKPQPHADDLGDEQNEGVFDDTVDCVHMWLLLVPGMVSVWFCIIIPLGL